MRKYAVLIVLACLFSFGSAQAEEKKRYCRSSSITNINPVLAGVERVVVAVNRVGPANSDKLLPEPLKKSNLEKLLKKLYEDRFTSRNGTYLSTNTIGCHDRNDQSVEIIDLMSKGGREAFEEETKKENTLSVMLFANIIPRGHVGMKMDTDIFTFYIAKMRPGVVEYKKFYNAYPFLITTATPEKRIDEILRSALKNQIH
ncbi:MAG: hypothetical protein ACTHOO_02085 [Alcanivorax sp.]